MRWVSSVWLKPIVLVLALCAGCSSKPKPEPTGVSVPSEATINAASLDVNFNQQIRNGAATGRTIYPHHFVIGDSELTMVGERQFSALLPRNDLEPARMIIPRGDASDVLYRARLDALRQRFVAAGYGEDRLVLVDELPAGDGIPSERVVLIASEEPRPGQGARGGAGRNPASNSPSGSGQMSGSGSRGTSSSSGSGGGSSGGYSR
jgi:uncharacterized membrane protein YgcG